MKVAFLPFKNPIQLKTLLAWPCNKPFSVPPKILNVQEDSHNCTNINSDYISINKEGCWEAI